MSRYGPVEPLTPEHETDSFECGSPAQSDWLRRYALLAQQAGTSRVYVVCREGAKRVAGYYALAAGSVEREAAPARVRRGTGHHPVPVILVTRLGVDLDEGGHGLGKALVKDALVRTVSAGDQIGVRAVLIHAESAQARAFYLHLAEFEPSATDPMHLFLLMKDLKATIRSPAAHP